MEDTLIHFKRLKNMVYPGENITYFCDAILVGSEFLYSVRDFNSEKLGYITCIFENNLESKF